MTSQFYYPGDPTSSELFYSNAFINYSSSSFLTAATYAENLDKSLFGYWSYKGQAQNIRNILHYVGEDYIERRYELGPAPAYSAADWNNEKISLGLEFPSLPYYICQDVKLTQSLAILRHLARKHDLTARNEPEQQYIDVVEQQLVDASQALHSVLQRCKFLESLGPYRQSYSDMLEPLNYLLEGHKWFLGDRITYLDFLAYDFLEFNVIAKKNCLEEFPNLLLFKKNFEGLPTMKIYFKTETYLALSPLGPML